jgi:hypothetical protein
MPMTASHRTEPRDINRDITGIRIAHAGAPLRERCGLIIHEVNGQPLGLLLIRLRDGEADFVFISSMTASTHRSRITPVHV